MELQELAYAAGFDPDSFYSSTLREVLLKIRGSRRTENEAWKRARLVSYMIYCVNSDPEKRDSIYDLCPLDDDPTPEELEEIRQKQKEKEAAQMEKEYWAAIENYKQHGIEF